MSESAEIKLVLKKKGLNYRLKDHNVEDNGEETFTFVDVLKGTRISGKVIKKFNEGEICNWPLLQHENISPLIDVLYIRDDFKIFLSIEREMTLKDIVHDEEFVYDPRCFERKRSYARGIFSGLSYLHGKSLCLMNLSDTNIVISKLCDKAIITDFSSLVSARKTNKSKMKVLDVYRAPETEKGDFDPIEAEIWASGTLMLEMFLAHMVPWAVIDYKPKKVMEIVDKLSLELLQAANTGSVVSSLDLSKFKTFLKCFFKQNPAARISARYAAIASFLGPKFQIGTSQAGITNETVQAQGGKQIQREGCKTATGPVTESQRLVSKRTGSWNLEKGADSVEIPSWFFYNSSDSLAVSETACEPEKVFKRCQSMITWTNKDAESDNARYESKSLSFIKQKSDDSHNACNEQISLNRTCSFPYVGASSKKKPIKFNLQNGDLSSLFSDDNLANEFSGSKDIVLPKEYVRKVSSERISTSDLREIVKKINLLQECRNSLQNLFKVFISDEFANSHFQFLKEYELLLHQTNVELFSELKNLCERNLRQENLRLLADQKKILGLNSKARQMIEQNGNIPPTHQRDSLVSEVFQDRFFETENVKETIKDLSIAEKTPGSEEVMDIIMPNVRLHTAIPCFRAIKNSENTWTIILDEQGFKKNDGEVKEEKNNKKGQNRKKVKNEKKPQNIIKDANNKQIKKPFFFSLCPGGKIENSELSLENLCEACKITHYHVLCDE